MSEQTSIPEDLKFSAEMIRTDLMYWLADHPESTLGELQAFLEAVQEEMYSYNGDELIVDYWDELADAAEYLNMWGDPEDSDEPLTFSYRLANVEEDRMHVDDLVEGLGCSFLMSDLPVPAHLQEKAKTA